MRTILFLPALLAAGLVGALLASQVWQPELARPAPGSLPPELTPRVEALEDVVARLQVKLLDLGSRMADRETDVGPPEASSVEATGEGLLPSTLLEDEEVKRMMMDVIEEREAAQRKARTERMEADLAERENDRLARLAEELGLNPYQFEEIRRLLEERREAMRAFRDRMFEGSDTREDREALRKEIDALRDSFDEKIRSLLDPGQYEAFEKADRGSGPPGGGPGGQGGPGRGPPPR